MPDPQGENTSLNSTPNNEHRKSWVQYDKKEMADLIELYNKDKDALREKFKANLQKRLQKGPLNDSDIVFHYYGNVQGIGEKFTELMKEAYTQLKEEETYQEILNDPTNFVIVEDNIHNTEKGADPIELFSGTFIHSNDDIIIAGAGMDFVFKRTHSNQSFYNGPLGEKWDHNYNLRLKITPDYNIIYRSNGKGGETIYRKHNNQDYWLTEKGEDGIITQLGNQFIWQDSNGIEFCYEPQLNTINTYLILEIRDRFGNKLEFTHDNDGLLKVVSINHNKRFVEFHYDTTNKIDYIRDFFERVWHYVYDDFNDLVAVLSPEPEEFGSRAVTRYEYSSSYTSDKTLQHNITAIMDANGQIYLENEYGTNPGLISYNRVVHQRQGSGDTLLDYEEIIEDFDIYYEANQKPFSQTILTGRNGHSVRYIFNRFGNAILKEEYMRINGIPKIISSYYRYNRDGNLIGTISPEGVVTQFLYGRDYYERNRVMKEDYLDIEDSTLTPEVRRSFNRLLATVKRGSYYSIASLNLSSGLWKDIFPDIYQTSEIDVIQKFTFESLYGQPLTISDTRYTRSANPDYVELPNYYDHLIRYSYKPKSGGLDTSQFDLLDKIEMPSYKSPDGIVQGPPIFEMPSYDNRGRLLECIGPEGLTASFSYGTSGTLTGFLRETCFDPAQLSIKTVVDRDDLGRIIKTYSPKFFDGMDNKFITTNKYNNLGQILSVEGTPPFQFRVTCKYNRIGNVIRESFDRKRADGSPYDEPLINKTYEYDEEFHLIKTTIGGSEPSGRKKFKNVYDRSGRLYLVISPAGRISKLHYNESSLIAKKVHGHGNIFATTKMFYDGNGRLIREISSDGAERRFFYDPLDRIIESQDSLGNKRLLTYDKRGNVLVERFFEKHQSGYRLLSRIQYTYDELGRPNRSSVNHFDFADDKDESDLETAYLDTGPGDLATRLYFYDKSGQIIKTVDPKGSAIHMQYDKIGRLIKRTDAYGNETNYQYDKHGNIMRIDLVEVIRESATNNIIASNYFASSFTYDELDRKIMQTNSLGNSIHYAYDSLDQMTKVIDPLGKTIQREYDIFGRDIQTTRLVETGTGHTYPINTEYKYDQDDFLTEQIDALGRVTKFEHDSMGRVISNILPDGSRDISTYDSANRILSYKDRNGLLIIYEYDRLGRLINTHVDETNLVPQVKLIGPHENKYKYDALGRIIFMENEICKYSISHNSLGLIILENNVYLSPSNPNNQISYEIKRNYDIGGTLKSIDYPSGRRIRYHRDILDRIIAIEQEIAGLDYPGDKSIPSSFIIMSIEYAGLRRKRIQRFNQSSTEFQYDRDSRIIEIGHFYKKGLLARLQYLHDGSGNIRQKNEASTHSNRKFTFIYDSLNRINEVLNKDMNSIINLESLYPFTEPIAEIIPDSQLQINSLIQENLPFTRRFTYDVCGNRLTKEDKNASAEEYHMDNNNLDQYSSIDSDTLGYDKMGNLTEDNNWKYRYNYRSQLSSVEPKDQLSAENIRFYHDPMGRKILEIRNNQSMAYVYDGWNVIEEYVDNNIHSSIVMDEGIDNIIEVSTQNLNYWTCSDNIKSVSYIMNGEEEDFHMEYDEFGRLKSPIHDEIVLNRFAGKRIIPELETYDFGFRTYDPKMGRFLQRDPDGYADGPNLYTYASNNPISRIDPFGTDSRQNEDIFDDVKNLQLYKILKNYDDKGVTRFVSGELTPIEAFATLEIYKLRRNWFWTNEQARQYHRENPWETEDFYNGIKSRYVRYLQLKGLDMISQFSRIDSSAGIGNIIGGLTAATVFGFLAPTAAAVVGAYDAGVTIPELYTGESSGVGSINLVTGNIDTGRKLSTLEKVLGGVGVATFVAGTVVSVRGNQLRGNPFANLPDDEIESALSTIKSEYNYRIPISASEAGAPLESLVPVSRWGRPGLQPGDWVMPGPPTRMNYILSFKWTPSWVPGKNIPAPRTSGEGYMVPPQSVKWPTGGVREGLIKGLYGQRKYIPSSP